MRVLVVDDEEIIADTLAAILNMSGFHAVAVYSGPEAIARAGHWDVLLTDVFMPDMNGIQASQEFSKICPDCKVILISGHAGTELLLAAAHDHGIDYEVIAKPVHPLEIIERLRAIEPVIH